MPVTPIPAPPAVTTNSSPGLVPHLAGVASAVPVDDGAGGIAFRQLTLDDLAAAFSITSFSPGFTTGRELGNTLTHPSFTAAYNAALASATLNDGSGALTITAGQENAFAFDAGASGLPARTYTGTTINQNVTFTLTATKVGGSPVKTASISANIGQGHGWYGVHAVPGSYDETFIKSLSSQVSNTTGFGRTLSYSAGGGFKLYYVYPTAYGSPSSIKDQNGFIFPMTAVATGVALTNSFSASIPGGMTVLESDNFITATFTLTFA